MREYLAYDGETVLVVSEKRNISRTPMFVWWLTEWELVNNSLRGKSYARVIIEESFPSQ